MPNIPFPYFSIALDAFGLVIMITIFVSCLDELVRKKSGSPYFFLLLLFTIITLAADIVGWFGEGHPSVSYMTLIAGTVASSSCHIAILCFIGYLKQTLYRSNKIASTILVLLTILCAASIIFLIGNVFYRYAFTVDPEGHYVYADSVIVLSLYMPFPFLAFLSIIGMSLLADRSRPVHPFAFIGYTVFPVAGLVVDFLIHGLSLTYIGFVVSVVMIYTGIYLHKQKVINDQRNALMMSQINPHFMYNTLSTIAAMCEVSPTEAKDLTVEFSRYLRRNLSTLTSEDLIPFETEMQHVECYLNIEKARFREKLNVIYSIRCKDFRVPALSIQPLVENAVKHGITKKAAGGTIKISAYSTAKHYVVTIVDDGAGFDVTAPPSDTSRVHIGLQNVKSRISQMCRGTLYVKSTVGVGTRVTIAIPKKKGRHHEHTRS